MNPEEIKQKTMTMRSGMVRMLRDREYWTAEDVETLKNEYYAGTSINEIAIMLDRSESAVYQKIEQPRKSALFLSPNIYSSFPMLFMEQDTISEQHASSPKSCGLNTNESMYPAPGSFR